MGKPKIRFEGYSEDWEQRKVLDLLIQPITDGPHETPKLVEEGVPFISVDAIVDNKIDFNRKRGNISEEYDELCCKKYKPQFHDVYLVKSGSTVGKVAIVETTDRFNIWSPLAAMRCGEKTYPYFLYDLLQTKDLQAQVADKASNGTQPNLSMRELEKFPVSVPSNLEEQKKIGDYFRNLDHLITLHQRKYDETKTLKKYMLQKMFPQNGEKVLEIRFDGFTEDWEQRKLDDVLKRRIEQRQQSEEYPRLAFASGQGVIPLSERKTNNREQLTKDEYTKKYLVTELNDIVYNPANVKYGAIDRNKCGRGVISPIYVTFTTNEVPGFIERIVTSHDFQQRALRFEEGTVTKRQSVNPEDLVTLDILVAPKREEQQKIATYFDALDHLITLHQRKCNELKEIKKYMLQNMFV
mgnify:CR=1 FL=1